MIERYTIKFGPAVSQKELEEALNEGAKVNADHLNKVKARIDVIADFEDLRKVAQVLKDLAKG